MQKAGRDYPSAQVGIGQLRLGPDSRPSPQLLKLSPVTPLGFGHAPLPASYHLPAISPMCSMPFSCPSLPAFKQLG